MISSSPTALITMHNVKQFLEESTCVSFPTTPSRRANPTPPSHSFIPSQAARQSNTRTEDVLHIIRKRTSIDPSGREHESRTRYFVVDAVEALGKFGPDAWERVVCVMTTGQAWQFRPYKWNEPIQLFHHGELRVAVAFFFFCDGS
jgi:parafibromin